MSKRTETEAYETPAAAKSSQAPSASLPAAPAAPAASAASADKQPTRKAGKRAPNIVDYVQTEFATFGQKPFSDVDSLVLSVLSYFHLPKRLAGANSWEGVRLVELFRADCFDELYGTLWDPDSSARLLAALAASPRFRDIRVMGYRVRNDPAQEKQFGALALQLSDAEAFIAFRGTDNTILGWKEDFNMAFRYPVPSQEEACRYLEEAARHVRGRLLLGGHSKGGNLAVYAAFSCSQSVRSRIEHVFSHDGPGFPETVFQDGSIDRVRDRVHKTLPQSSIVGMLLEHQEDYQVVRSSTFSAFQHDPYSWVVEDGAFVAEGSLTPAAKYLDLTLNAWVQSLSAREREQVIDSVYALVESAGQTTMAGMRDNWQKAVPEIISSALRMDDDSRALILQAVKELVVLGGKKVPEMFARKASPGSSEQAERG